MQPERNDPAPQSQPTRSARQRREELLELVRRQLELSKMIDVLPAPGSRFGSITREFFAESWKNALTEVLSKTKRLIVTPKNLPYPRCFTFEVDTPYKRKRGSLAPVELVSGPLRGQILYHPRPFEAGEDEALLSVMLDGDQSFLHPNCHRRTGILCLGKLPPGPLELAPALLHIFSIVTYGNMSLSDPLDPEAAHYFAADPNARLGLPPTPPLYGPADRAARNGGEA